MRLIYTILLLFISFFAVGQNQYDSTIIRKSILNKAKKIPSYNSAFHTEYFRGTYDNVFKKANETELYQLTNNPNPLIRRSALFVLVSHNSEKVVELLDKNSGDTTLYFLI